MSGASGFAAYQAVEAVNWSLLKLMADSPRAFKRARDKPPELDSKPIRIGLAADSLVYSPDEFDARFAVYDGRRDKRTSEYREFLENHFGKHILSPAEHAAAMQIVSTLAANPDASAALAGFSQSPLIWTDSETGLLCKGLVDSHDEGVADLKTTGISGVGWVQKFHQHIERMGYAKQLTYYWDGLVANGHDPQFARIVVVQQCEPFDSAVIELSHEDRREARAEYRKLLARVKECEASGVWPGAAPGIIQWERPEWAVSNDDFFDGMEELSA